LTTANTAQTEGPSGSRQAASLEFREATKRYPGADRPAVDGLTLDVPAVVGVLCIELLSHTIAS
jgi:osmoprotectant transport system ATP-binding protein